MSFADITDLFTGHMEWKSHCWEVATSNAADWKDWVGQAKDHGVVLSLGTCKGKAIHSDEHHGATITEFGAGEPQGAPFTMLDETIHVDNWQNHDFCVTFSGSNSKMNNVRKLIGGFQPVVNGPCEGKKMGCMTMPTGY